MGSKVAELSDAEFDQFIQEGVTLVDFWAPWCQPCKRIAPILEELAGEMTQVRFGKLNTDENQETAAKHGVMSIPTLMVFRGGQKIDQVIGAVPKETLEATLKKHV